MHLRQVILACVTHGALNASHFFRQSIILHDVVCVVFAGISL